MPAIEGGGTPRDRDLPELTDSELEVMKALWRSGAQSAREVHGELVRRLGWAYTTTRTMLDRMVEKGLLSRRSEHRLYVYEAALSRPRGLAGLVRRFARRVLEVEPASVVSLFGESLKLTDREIEELKALIAAAEDG